MKIPMKPTNKLASILIPEKFRKGLLHQSHQKVAQYHFGNVLLQEYKDAFGTVQDYTFDIMKHSSQIPFHFPEDRFLLFFIFYQDLAFAGAEHSMTIFHKGEFGLLAGKDYTLMLDKGLHQIFVIELSKDSAQALSSTYKVLDSLKPICRPISAAITPSIEKAYKQLQSSSLTGEPWDIFRQISITQIIVDALYELDNVMPVAIYEDQRFISIKIFVLENLDKKLDIHKIASKFNMLPETLRKGFKRTYGYNLSSFIRKERMLKAASLLRITSLPIQEIAWEVGYESPTAFTRIFAAFYGQSPNDFRLRMR